VKNINKDKEIEIKISLGKKSFLGIEKKILKIAKFKNKSHQVDEYFTPAHRNFVKPKFPYEWLRIGERGNQVLITYKHFYPENAEKHIYCDEYETKIEDIEALGKIFTALNFKKLITVDKKREIYLYKNEFEISLDKVKDLGYFIEIEAKKDFGGIRRTRQRLFKFARELVLDLSKMDERGYPFLLMKKRGLIK